MNRQLGIRRSYIAEARRIALEFIEHNLQTLVFANNRLATELLVTYLKDACERGPLPNDAVRGYRGGYLPRERREIERKLRDGEIRAVVATNALELGIDIGSLDAVVMAGYPGTIASTWQRAGRAGRRQGASAAVLVASSAPLDQYIVEHPDYFFGRSPEHAYINPDNLEILLAHLKCAAFELPMQDGEKFGAHEPPSCAGFWKRPDSCTIPRAPGTGPRNLSRRRDQPALGIERQLRGGGYYRRARGDCGSGVYGGTDYPARKGHLSARSPAVSTWSGSITRNARPTCAAWIAIIIPTPSITRRCRRCEEFESEAFGGRAQGPRRRAREPADRGLQEDQVLHQGKRGRGQALDARAGDAYDGLLAAFPGRVSGAVRGLRRPRGRAACAGLGNALRTVAALLLMCDPRDLVA